MLLEHGSDIDALTTFGQGAVVDCLLLRGANPNTQMCASGEAPLLNACLTGRLEIIKLLVENGANANGTNRSGRRPLHVGCVLGQSATVQALMEAGASLEAQEERESGFRCPAPSRQHRGCRSCLPHRSYSYMAGEYFQWSTVAYQGIDPKRCRLSCDFKGAQ